MDSKKSFVPAWGALAKGLLPGGVSKTIILFYLFFKPLSDIISCVPHYLNTRTILLLSGQYQLRETLIKLRSFQTGAKTKAETTVS